MANIYEQIIREEDEILEQTLLWRHDIHQHPELGNMEFRTSRIVAEHLRSIGADEVYEGLAGGTGVIGIIRGAHDGPTVGIRADMDALPVKECTGLPFASRVTSEWGGETVPVMHACGHDVHTAMAMAAASVVCKLREHLHGNAMFCFQPAEEGPSPGWSGLHGAQALMASEVFRKNTPAAMFALHVDPTQPIGSAGQVAALGGQTCMAISGFDIDVYGIGGHNAKPWQGIDTLLPAAQILQGLQNITTRNVDPNTNKVILTIGKLIGGTKYNVIADHAVISGALRFTDYPTRQYLESRVEEVAAGGASAGRAKAKVTWNMHYPPNFNSAELIAQMKPCVEKVLGAGQYVVGERGFHIADDFSYFTLRIPSIYALLSCAPDEGDASKTPGLHNPDMIVNERCIPSGIRTLCTYLLTYGCAEGEVTG